MRRISAVLLALAMVLAVQTAGCTVREGGKNDTPEDPSVTRPGDREDVYRSSGHAEAMREGATSADSEDSDGE